MAAYTNYDASTGEIHSSGFAPDGTESDFIAPGCAQFIGAAFSAEHHYFADGAPVPYTAEQATRKRMPRLGAGAWSNAAMDYADARTLAQAQHQARVRIQRAAMTAEYGSFSWNGETWSADPVSAGRIRSQVMRTLNPYGARAAGDVLTSTGTAVGLDNAAVQQLGEALEAHVEAVQVQHLARLQAIEAATTVAQADAVQWSDTE